MIGHCPCRWIDREGIILTRYGSRGGIVRVHRIDNRLAKRIRFVDGLIRIFIQIIQGCCSKQSQRNFDRSRITSLQCSRPRRSTARSVKRQSIASRVAFIDQPIAGICLAKRISIFDQRPYRRIIIVDLREYRAVFTDRDRWRNRCHTAPRFSQFNLVDFMPFDQVIVHGIDAKCQLG